MEKDKEPTNNPLKKGKTLLLFDIDGTLTESRKVMKDNMLECLKKASTYDDIDLATVGGSSKSKRTISISNRFTQICFHRKWFSLFR